MVFNIHNLLTRLYPVVQIDRYHPPDYLQFSAHPLFYDELLGLLRRSLDGHYVIRKGPRNDGYFVFEVIRLNRQVNV